MWVRQSCDEADGEVKHSGGLEAEADRINAVRASGETGENTLDKQPQGAKNTQKHTQRTSVTAASLRPRISSSQRSDRHASYQETGSGPSSGQIPASLLKIKGNQDKCIYNRANDRMFLCFTPAGD